MSNFTSFAVAGAGGLGNFIVSALAAQPNANIVVLSRSASTASLPANVTHKKVDYGSPDFLAEALKGVEVVISTLNGAGFAVQEPLATAARKAGVRLFVPSEFGNPTEGVTQGPLLPKELFAKHLREIELPSLRVFTGPFPDFLFNPYVGFEFPAGKAAWVGKGDTPIGFTARPDIAAFLAYTLTNLAPSSLSNKIFRIEGDRKTFNDAVALYEKTHPGKTVTVSRTPVEDAKRKIALDPTGSVLVYLFLSWEEGTSPYSSGKLDNELYPNWKPKTVESIVAAFD